MNMMKSLEDQDAKRWRERTALLKVAQEAASTAGYLQYVGLTETGSKILKRLTKALKELDEVDRQVDDVEQTDKGNNQNV